MDKKVLIAYAKIVKIIESGKIGTPQVIVFSVNDNGDKVQVCNKIFEELTLADGIFNCKIKNKKSTFVEQPFMHGFIVREYEKGQILRYTLTATPANCNTYLTVFGNDGEIRYDLQSGKIFTLKQIPDYVGDEFLDQVNVDGVLDLEDGKVGANQVSNEILALNREVSKIF